MFTSSGFKISQSCEKRFIHAISCTNDDKIVSVLEKLMNKCAYCVIKVERYNVLKNISRDEFWNAMMCFYIFQKFDAKLFFMACNKMLSYSKVCSHSVPFWNSLTWFVIYYFVIKDWNSFKKCLRWRKNCKDINKVDIFDQIGNINNTTRERYYWFSSTCNVDERLVIVRKTIPLLAADEYRKENAQFLQHDKYVTIMANLLMLKECNYSGCNKKDIVLKRCKNCVCVYYCCRLCQTKDWLSHRCVCKKSKSRNYLITCKLQQVN